MFTMLLQFIGQAIDPIKFNKYFITIQKYAKFKFIFI